MRRIIATLLFAALAGAARAEGGLKGEGHLDSRSSRDVCREAERVKLPSPDPASNVRANCDPEALYDGVGRPPNVQAARACALMKLSKHEPNVVETGSIGVLAMVYANGAGVKRDVDIAIAYACQLDGAPAEMSGRIDHLLDLKAKGPGKTPFDICDDITSGMMMGYCAERSSARTAAMRNAKIESLTRGFDGAHKAAFAKLTKAKEAFIKGVADNEVDTSGTGRNAFIAEARDAHQAAFLKTLESALAGTLPPSSPAAFEKADKALNVAYAKVMGLKDTAMLGTVEKKGIKATQRLWIVYRDAFSAFVAKAPTEKMPTNPQQVALALTEQRTKDLSEFAR